VSGLVGVRFRRAGRVYYFDPGQLQDVAVGDWLIVETARGPEAGWVVIAPSQVVSAEVDDLKPVMRLATWRELTEWASLRTREGAALAQAAALIAQHKLPMKPVKAEYNFDGSQLTVYFITDVQRVDFRGLVRDLARTLRTRVHLHQIGPRDWSKLTGGFNRCGLELCCSCWMTDFAPISIRMAKRQSLPLNPAEISGVCGKLLCCLAYEDDLYRDCLVGLPRVGAIVTTAADRGKVIEANVLARQVTIAWDSGSRSVVGAAELAALRPGGAGGADAVGAGDGPDEPEAGGGDDGQGPASASGTAAGPNGAP
jgi:cell fate regulator YaaT (PSP1 superfamily)